MPQFIKLFLANIFKRIEKKYVLFWFFHTFTEANCKILTQLQV